MHVGAVLVFEAGPLELRSGGIDIERVRAYTAERISSSPRARQREVGLALGRLPVWVDDPFFDLAYHVRHASLPRPGDERQLKRLAARIFSQALDPEKPPWELWVVEGLDEGRFALIAKAEAAFVADGAGFDPLAAVVTGVPREAIDVAPRIESRLTPGRVALMRAELARRAREISRPESVGAALGHGLRGALNALERVLASRSELPLTGPSGPHRRIEFLALDQADLRQLGESLAASRQAVLLATLAGALRMFVSRRGLDPADFDLRALTPVGVGVGESEVEVPLADLPSSEADPLRRLDALCDVPEPVAPGEPAFPADAALTVLEDLACRMLAAASGRPASLCVTTLSAPATKLFLLGSAMRACIAVAPLLPGHTLGITATFADGRVMLGFSGDAALAADLPLLADSVAASFDELRRLTGGSVQQARARADQVRVRNFGAEA